MIWVIYTPFASLRPEVGLLTQSEVLHRFQGYPRLEFIRFCLYGDARIDTPTFYEVCDTQRLCAERCANWFGSDSLVTPLPPFRGRPAQETLLALWRNIDHDTDVEELIVKRAPNPPDAVIWSLDQHSPEIWRVV